MTAQQDEGALQETLIKLMDKEFHPSFSASTQMHHEVALTSI